MLALMRDHNVACCVSDEVEGLNVPFADTSNWGYLRLRQCEYSDSQLSETLQRMTQQRWREAYVFFKHEAQATGPKLANRLIKLHAAAAK